MKGRHFNLSCKSLDAIMYTRQLAMRDQAVSRFSLCNYTTSILPLKSHITVYRGLVFLLPHTLVLWLSVCGPNRSLLSFGSISLIEVMLAY
ncbi:hypothetical protein GDO81_026578 [Engystomops pustulosus]|uniref:Uncharacterized protein n=1 Tax=Engystomops pustulosus TaxID=76066 RepID=A0AAV6YMA7_ENGPU|nr:hypothetical protein GDO81_026578 [Engystomops pustulosus]